MMKKSSNGYFDKNVKITSYVNFAYDKDSRVDLDTETDVNRYSTTSSTANLDVDREEDSRTPSTLDSEDLNSQSDVTVEKCPSRWTAYSGIFCAMASSVFFTLTAAIVKYLKDVHPGMFVTNISVNEI